MSLANIAFVAYLVAHVAVLLRAIAAEGREPTSRAAWILILVFVPGVGIVAYLLLGEPWVGARLRRTERIVMRALTDHVNASIEPALGRVPERFRPAFRTCENLAEMRVAPDNAVELVADSNAAIERLVADLDRAEESIHLAFYIWLADTNGHKVVEALVRAARRGIACRVLADDVGSRPLIRSRDWGAMRAAGVELAAARKVFRGFGFTRGTRLDLRNHRKIVVIDNRITWCGSQNLADPEFRIKPRFAPWVDVMLRIEGPVALQNQVLFAADWKLETGADLSAVVAASVPVGSVAGCPAIAFGTGPTSPRGAMTDVFVALLASAAEEVVVTNPYFVPDPPLLAALIGCARRRVRTRLILPKRNDSWLIGTISRACYGPLIEAGVRVHEYTKGLLHAKTVLVDGEVALIGSSNMDRRSLDLNYENNLLLHSPKLAAALHARQDLWLIDSDEVPPNYARDRSFGRRIGENIIAILGPVL